MTLRYCTKNLRILSKQADLFNETVLTLCMHSKTFDYQQNNSIKPPSASKDLNFKKNLSASENMSWQVNLVKATQSREQSQFLWCCKLHIALLSSHNTIQLLERSLKDEKMQQNEQSSTLFKSLLLLLLLLTQDWHKLLPQRFLTQMSLIGRNKHLHLAQNSIIITSNFPQTTFSDTLILHHADRSNGDLNNNYSKKISHYNWPALKFTSRLK